MYTQDKSFRVFRISSSTVFPLIPLRQRYSRPVFQINKPRVNEQIRVPEVLLVAEDGAAEKLPIAEAIRRAQEQGYDLIEVSPKAVPPVVKIGDFGSYLYRLKKKEKQQKSHSKQTEVKVIRFGFRTDVGDLNRLADQSREFLAERNMVKVSVTLRGRELSNQQFAVDKLKKFILGLADAAEVDQPAKKQGNQYIVILRPKK
ncbi:translation initiation factor IF-3 [Candidatus Peribacteria bacterium]|nr:translation initiation factor IF-3 [Candidatus Peribacteria bacterium]